MGRVMPAWKREDLDGIALELEARLSTRGEVIEVGSYARKEAEVHDLDLLLITEDLERDVEPILRGLPILRIKHEDKKTAVLLDVGGKPLRVEIWKAPPARRGAAELYLMGPTPFNREMRRRAQEKEMHLDFHGLSDEDGLVEAKSQERIFEKLGMEYVPPEQRKP
jgi:DNA polymerase (family 10)